jgi:hypothetical protein
MRKLFVIQFFIFVNLSFNSAFARNEVVNGNLVLSQQANQALKSYDNQFRVFQIRHFDAAVTEASEFPFFVKIDINGDAQDDLNIFGYNLEKRKATALTLLSRGGGYTAVELHSYDLTRDMFSNNPIYISTETVRDFNGVTGRVISLREIEKETYNGVERVNHLAPRRFYHSPRNTMEPFLMSFSD